MRRQIVYEVRGDFSPWCGISLFHFIMFVKNKQPQLSNEPQLNNGQIPSARAISGTGWACITLLERVEPGPVRHCCPGGSISLFFPLSG